MTLVFQTKIDQVGMFANKFFDEGLFILFSSNEVMSEIKNYCVLTSDSEIFQNIEKGQTLTIGDKDFEIIAVGHLVEENIKTRGHVTINALNDPNDSTLPGTIYIEGKKLPKVEQGTKITIEDS
ncbi:PTS glucitol/sorbitol transporter subunit IIA [Staphylococcus kloosii]|jgi:PTS system glucitol/sorbitol-specific IIA component|uniref:PTS glucitol/sorbitol transporter subunit IIA n=1 Tax=Staphylococcus kloosii TaxID=29384 RepID=UPI001E4B99EB|nr:PTS glucitol/sorbitol transporter subunit IIA [Staphylococcus kloosii]MCD8879144.1 PTS glucitol/sorbitol transporter subunit IIA [Staphylococcus kloosii]